MNDRYLYRAKRKNWRELPKEMWWVEGYLYGIWERRYILWGMTNDVPNMVEVDPSTICQCTGLKDKNDKDIYEGDILRKSGYWDVRVEFERGQFCIKGADIVQYLNNTIDDSIRNFPVDEYEVIGNIFDNAELLEK